MCGSRGRCAWEPGKGGAEHLKGSMDACGKRFDWIAAFALCLAVIIMIYPTEADILLVIFEKGQIVLGTLVAIACFASVLFPVMLSWRRHRHQPAVWRGRGYLNTATVILAINFLMFGTVIIDQWLKYSGLKRTALPSHNGLVEGDRPK
jgi:hypothetical protein